VIDDYVACTSQGVWYNRYRVWWVNKLSTTGLIARNHDAAKSPITNHSFAFSVLTIVHEEYLALRKRPGVAKSVTPAPASILVLPVPRWTTVMLVPVTKATLEAGGTVRSLAELESIMMIVSAASPAASV
jgi:hypothetical protein